MTTEQKRQLESTFRKHGQALLEFVRSRLNSLQDSQDVVQEVYLQALRQMNAIEPIDNLVGWLFAVAKNKVIDVYRKQRPETVSLSDSSDENTTLEELVDFTSDEQLDEKTLELINDMIIEAIERLPEKQKFVFVQQVIEERTFREIASELQEPINTVIARKRYAVQFLRQELKDLKKILEK